MINKLCHFIYIKVLGWGLEGDIPDCDKYVFAVVPHTSNWDFVYGWLALRTYGLKVTIFAKDVFYTWPLNYVCDFFGVAPVNRRKSTNFVDSVASMFEKQDNLIAVITPEGTRSFNAQVKSGYYYLAKKAGVPIVLAGPDFKAKKFVIAKPRPPKESFKEDTDELIEFCKTLNAKSPKDTFSKDTEA